MSEALVKEITLACDPEHAFVVFTSKVDLWWPPGHRPSGTVSMHLEAQSGGSFYAQRVADRVDLGTVIKVEPSQYLEYTWNPGRGTGPTTVQVEFIDEDGVTRVRVTHLEGDGGLGEQWPERVKIFTNAWSAVLAALENFVKHD